MDTLKTRDKNNYGLDYDMLLTDWAADLFTQAEDFEALMKQAALGSYQHGYYKGKHEATIMAITNLTMLEGRKNKKYRKLYCGIDRKTGAYEYFFSSKRQVGMCGVSEKNIVEVKIEEVDDNSGKYYGFKDVSSGAIDYIYGSKSVVEMCSPDGFKSKIESGDGQIVNLTIIEVSYS